MSEPGVTDPGADTDVPVSGSWPLRPLVPGVLSVPGAPSTADAPASGASADEVDASMDVLVLAPVLPSNPPADTLSASWPPWLSTASRPMAPAVPAIAPRMVLSFMPRPAPEAIRAAVDPAPEPPAPVLMAASRPAVWASGVVGPRMPLTILVDPSSIPLRIISRILSRAMVTAAMSRMETIVTVTLNAVPAVAPTPDPVTMLANGPSMMPGTLVMNILTSWYRNTVMMTSPIMTMP